MCVEDNGVLFGIWLVRRRKKRTTQSEVTENKQRYFFTASISNIFQVLTSSLQTQQPDTHTNLLRKDMGKQVLPDCKFSCYLYMS